MNDIETPGQKTFIGSLARRRKESGGSAWHMSDETVFFPRECEVFDNLELVADEHLFNYHTPDTPPFTSDAKLITMGSCFADRLRRWLSSQGKHAENVDVPSGLNNSFAVRQFIEWVFTGKRSEDAYWYDKDENGAIHWEAKDEHEVYRQAYSQMSGLVVTLGLAEVWRDKETGGVFWRGVPETLFDRSRHECVISTVEENVENMRRIIRVVRENVGQAPVIFTLSPVPLAATMRGISPIVGDCVSKSTLRVAIDIVMREQHEDVYYWPAFEMVRWVGSHYPASAFGADNTPRHPANHIVKIIVDRFVRAFFGDDAANKGAETTEAVASGEVDNG